MITSRRDVDEIGFAVKHDASSVFNQTSRQNMVNFSALGQALSCIGAGFPAGFLNAFVFVQPARFEFFSFRQHFVFGTLILLGVFGMLAILEVCN